MTTNYLPAGYSDSDSDSDFDYNQYYYGKKKKIYLPVKSEEETFKENLIKHLKDNDVIGLRYELDHGKFKGFNIDSKVSFDWNLLFHAIFEGKAEIVKFLIDERGVNINLHLDSETPLIIACKSSADSEEIFKIVKLLLKESVNIHSTNRLGQNALMLACFNGHIKVVEFLMNKGAPIDEVDNDGCNALFHAIEGNHVEIAKLLINSGIDLTVTDKYNNTAKMFAESELRKEILELFPPEEYRYEIPSDYLSYSNFKTIIPNTLSNDNDVPPYFTDVYNMLYGMNAENFAPKFAQAEISLEEFLTITDTRMKEIDIMMPYQRAEIHLGIFKLFSTKWSKNSLYIPPNITSHISQLDLIYVLSNLLRQIITMKSQLIYFQNMNFDIDQECTERFLSLNFLHQFQEHLRVIEAIAKKKMKAAKKPLLIKKEQNKKTKVFLGITIGTILSLISLRFIFKKN